MASWFVRENSSRWRRAETAPSFTPAAIERTAGGEWIILAPPSAAISVNGIPVQSGVQLLRHKDEVAAEHGRIAYFTTEVVPEVVTFSGPTAKCGRCRKPIAEGATAVRCACGVWYDAQCFEYGDKPVCVACGRPTRLDASGLWTPEDEC
jgi:hypothetical protein